MESGGERVSAMVDWQGKGREETAGGGNGPRHDLLVRKWNRIRPTLIFHPHKCGLEFMQVDV